MPGKIVLVGFVLLGSLLAMGCDQTSHGQTAFQADEWATYTSPDKRVSFEYPSDLNLTIRPRQDETDPQLALMMESPDRSLGLTLVMRVLERPDPDYCQYMLKAFLDDNTIATSPSESVTRGRATGFRQEFKSGNGVLAGDLVGLVLQDDLICVHFSCSYGRMRAGELRPICNRIVDSLVIEPSASALAVQTTGE
jgi:hypothetical protein